MLKKPVPQRRRPASKPKNARTAQAKPYAGLSFLKSFAERGAKEVIVLDPRGRPVCATVKYNRACLYSTYLKELYNFVRTGVRDMNPANDLTFIRLRFEKREVMITASTGFTLIVVQTFPQKKIMTEFE